MFEWPNLNTPYKYLLNIFEFSSLLLDIHIVYFNIFVETWST